MSLPSVELSCLGWDNGSKPNYVPNKVPSETIALALIQQLNQTTLSRSPVK